MDLYREYNRIRRNILRIAKRHGIEVLSLPTARQLNKKITLSDVKTITSQHQSIKAITAKKPKDTPLTKISSHKIRKRKVEQKTKKSKIKKYAKIRTKNLNKPKVEKKEKTYAGIYKKFGARYTAVANNGMIIDTRKGIEITSPLEPNADEIVGKYLHDTYGSEKYKKPSSSISELEMFKIYIQNRIDASMADYLSRDYKRRGSSQDGVFSVQAALDKMKNEDIATAKKRFDLYSSEIKNYLDDALWYTTADGDHDRALAIVCELLTIPLEDVSFDEAPTPDDIIDDIDKGSMFGEE